jgi:hypothetical protein
MIPTLYMSKANRDADFKKFGGRKSSIKNQLIHPMYVSDYTKETGVVLTAADCGFGNTIYKTHFATLYRLERA